MLVSSEARKQQAFFFCAGPLCLSPGVIMVFGAIGTCSINFWCVVYANLIWAGGWPGSPDIVGPIMWLNSTSHIPINSAPPFGSVSTSRILAVSVQARVSCWLPSLSTAFDNIQRTTTCSEPKADLNLTTMAFSSRSMPSGHLRQTSVSGATAGMSLQARVNEKREELENLKQLRDLSAAVASQMEALEEKLSTLSDGTEGTRIGQQQQQRNVFLAGTRPPTNFGIAAIATVMGNWHNVLRAINMASSVFPFCYFCMRTLVFPIL